MKHFFQGQRLAVMFVLLGMALAGAVSVYAATTIRSDISTDGNLTVGGNFVWDNTNQILEVFSTTNSYAAADIEPSVASNRNDFAAMFLSPSTAGHTLVNLFGLQINDQTSGTAPTNVYGVQIGDQTSGTNNWAIKTGLGKVEFGDVVQSDAAACVSLPACSGSTEGAMRAVNDSTTNTWGATITGAGSDHVLAYCDGTNWTVMAK